MKAVVKQSGGVVISVTYVPETKEEKAAAEAKAKAEAEANKGGDANS